MYHLKYVLNVLLLFFSIGLYGQAGPPALFKKCPVSTINYEQGLLNNQTEAVITDSLGFTWISTTIGLQRYNGYTLETINPVINGDTVKIKHAVYLFNLKNGRLWISYQNGIIEYDPGTNEFKNIITLKTPSESFYSIIPAKETDDGIWCAQQYLGLVLYSRDGKLLYKDHSVNVNAVNKIIETDDWLSTAAGDFIFIKAGENKLLQFSTAQRRLTAIREINSRITGLCCSKSSVYVNTVNGIERYGLNDWKLLNSCLFKAATDQTVVTGRSCFVNDDKLICGLNSQLLEYDPDLSKFKIFATLNGSPLLATGVIGIVYYDKFERIWLLTNDDVKRVQDREIPFTYLKYPASLNNFVRSVYFDEKKQLLLAGCLNGGLQLYDNAANPLWPAPLLTADVKDILGIEKLSDDAYLIVTWSRGWYRLDISQKKLTKLPFPKNSQFMDRLFDNGFTNNLQRINDSTILVACTTSVFSCIFRQDNLVSFRPLMPFVNNSNDHLTSFVYTRDNFLWGGTNKGGIYKIEKNGTIETFHLPDNITIRCMAEDADHNIWIGSNKGLYVYNSKGQLLKSFFKKSGLLNDCIYSLVPMDNDAAVFASSNMGLSNISLNGSIKNYTRELGLQDNEFNTDAALKTASGKMIFGGISGISAFYPSALKELHDKPSLNVIRLVINDSSYNSSAGIWKGDTIQLRHNQNHLQVDFAAMGLLNADKYLYKYRLLGFEKTWQSTYQPTGIRYILSPGSYTLQVTCTNIFSGQAFRKILTVIVHPPWWLTWWFLAFMGILITGVIIAIVTFYNRRRYQKKLQDLLIKQSLQNERERISRDLHDNLGAQANAIFYGTELLRQKKGHEQKLVDDLHDTAGDMLTVLRETLWAMKITQVEAADLWLRILNFARKIGTYYANLTIEITGTPPGGLTLNATIALNMILIVQEAINNAIRHAEASVITISSYASDNLWRIEIMDDGKGFDLSSVSKKTESYGLENMAERATESNITFEVNSLPQLGTKVFLEINISKMESQMIG
jgi:signal transduction histidine kinase/ligand-binding sensor domain-containing protein